MCPTEDSHTNTPTYIHLLVDSGRCDPKAVRTTVRGVTLQMRLHEGPFLTGNTQVFSDDFRRPTPCQYSPGMVECVISLFRLHAGDTQWAKHTHICPLQQLLYNPKGSGKPAAGATMLYQPHTYLSSSLLEGRFPTARVQSSTPSVTALPATERSAPPVWLGMIDR